jgi:plastocyanin domain-containing protein
VSIARTILAAALALTPAVATLGVAGVAQAEDAAPREIEVIVDGGYQPNKIVVKEGEKIRLKFVRKDYSPCTKEVVFPSLNIRRELPTNQPVYIDLPALPAGEVEFRCGMNMVKGTIVVEPRK